MKEEISFTYYRVMPSATACLWLMACTPRVLHNGVYTFELCFQVFQPHYMCVKNVQH